MTHKISIGIEAPNEQKAVELAKALVQIKNSLSDKDLLDLAKILKENPGIIQIAKKYLS
jgi:hypothetical protein